MDKITYALESFKNIQDLIKYIDQKSGAVLVVTGLIFAGYIEFLNDLTFTVSNKTSFLGILTFFSSLLTLLSITMVVYISIFKVLKPRKAKDYHKKELSLFYYEHIFKLGKENVLIQYENLDKKNRLKNIVDQQHEVSNILNQKTIELAKSFNWLFLAFLSVMVFIICSTLL